MSRKEVLKEIEEKSQRYSIQILGSKKNRAEGFYILLNTQEFSCTEKDKYHYIKKSSLELLDRAKVKYKII